MSHVKNKFTQIPNNIINGKLPTGPFRVICYLLTYQHKDIIFPSIWTIGNACGITEKTVDRALKYLKEQKLISIGKKNNKGHQSNTYIINFEQIDGDCVISPEELELRNLDMEVDSKLKKKKKIKENMYKNNKLEDTENNIDSSNPPC